MATAVELRKDRRTESHQPERNAISDSVRCSRCMGFMVTEQGFNSMLGTSEANVLLRRCVQCGEIIDPVILKNRLLQSGSHPAPVHK